MGIFDKVKLSNAESRLIEEQYYEAVVDELQQGNKRAGLWAKSLANAEGSEDKAKALYISYRVQSIKDEIEVSESIKREEVEASEYLKKETEEKKARKYTAEEKRREKKCFSSLKRLACSVKRKKDRWVISEILGGKYVVWTIDELESYTSDRMDMYKKNKEDSSKDEWTGNTIKNKTIDSSDDPVTTWETISVLIIILILALFMVLSLN